MDFLVHRYYLVQELQAVTLESRMLHPLVPCILIHQQDTLIKKTQTLALLLTGLEMVSFLLVTLQFFPQGILVHKPLGNLVLSECNDVGQEIVIGQRG